MAEEKKNEQQENEKNEHGKEHHHNWIEEAIEQLDTDFPLSGAETESDLEDTDEAADEKKED